MRLLLDQNLSRNLVASLRDVFPGSRHVTELGMSSATDAEIWSYASENGLLIVSRDSDFRQLAFLHGPPPKVVWLRVGNASTQQVLAVIVEHAEAIEAFVDNDEEALLVIPLLRSVDG